MEYSRISPQAFDLPDQDEAERMEARLANLGGEAAVSVEVPSCPKSVLAYPYATDTVLLMSHIYRSRLEYVALMDGYLAGGMGDLKFVQSFFDLRDDNVNADLKNGILDQGVGADRWEELFSELFWACEDVVLPGEEPISHPTSDGDEVIYSIDLVEFRRRVTDLRDRFVRFE